ncbi:MAG TPA: hypothetical protein VGQ65_11660 [Thermoanaerobaculia bacterium]|jgi:hypothetical protein|nr:hypothetical protein [Thermoanaerobaculia bacterium]
MSEAPNAGGVRRGEVSGQSESVESASPATPWWRSLAFWTKASGIVVGIITALASLVGTSYFAEKVKLTAQAQALEAKHESDSADRKDKNAAAERDLRTKYVDLALQPTLGVDHRARIFGYLRTVMADEAQRKWANAEAKKAEEQRARLSALRAELNTKTENHTRATQRYLETLDKSGVAATLTTILKKQYENEEEDIANLRIQIRDFQGDVPNPQSETAALTTLPAKPR